MATVDSTGVKSRSLASYVQLLGEQFQDAFGSDLDLAPETPQGQIIGIMALALAEQDEAIVHLGNAVSLDHATGNQLDELGSLLDINRRPATHSRVTATLTGTPGTGIPAGTRAATMGNALFETLAPVVLSASGIQVEMQSIESGPVVAQAGELTMIITQIAGWTAVTNVSDATLGRDAETDTLFRQRLIDRTANTAVSTISALGAALVEAEATRWRVEENNTGSDVARQGFTVFSHSVLPIAESGTDAAIDRAVREHRGMGAGITNVIIGTEPDNSDLDGINNGQIEWDGQTFTGLNLTSANTGAAKAAALQALINNSNVKVAFLDGVYYVFYRWAGSLPTFGTGTVEADFGLSAPMYPTGAFLRSVITDLTVEADVTIDRNRGFPADGLAQLRAACIDTVHAYAIGEGLWSNDLLGAMERIPGTRVSNLTIVDGENNAVSGTVPALNNTYRLQVSSLTINITGA